jgi:hypothetical protein
MPGTGLASNGVGLPAVTCRKSSREGGRGADELGNAPCCTSVVDAAGDVVAFVAAVAALMVVAVLAGLSLPRLSTEVLCFEGLDGMRRC